MGLGIALAILAIVIIVIIGAVGIYFYATADDGTIDSGTGGEGSTIPPVDDDKEEEKQDVEDKIDEAIYDAYGFHPANTCPKGTCMYGIIRTTGAHCRAIGGGMNGTPRDNQWCDCHVNFGRSAPRGLLAPNTCPSGTCQYGAFTTTGAHCRALGGAMNGTPGDNDSTLCHFNIGANPRWGFYAPGSCPSGRTCYPAQIQAVASQCRAIGGTTSATGNAWAPCSLLVGPARANA